MRNESVARVDRRWFLGFGMLAGALTGVGCDGGTEPGKPTGPPMEKGNRNRLENRKPVNPPSKTKGKTR
jgi:hypothetical protein